MLRNKKGSTGIIFILGIFISTIVISGFIGIISKTVAINEIQGILDTSGVAALRYAVDDTAWRKERFEINESTAKVKFKELAQQNVSTGNNKLLKDFKLVEVKIHLPNSSGLKKLGIPSGERNQYFLEAVAVASFSVDPITDAVDNAYVNYYNFFKSKSQTESIRGVIGDGAIEVVIRSVSRLVMR